MKVYKTKKKKKTITKKHTMNFIKNELANNPQGPLISFCALTLYGTK